MKGVALSLSPSINDTDGRVNLEFIYILQIDKSMSLGIWAQGLRTGGKGDIISDLIEIRNPADKHSHLEQGERSYGG